MKLHIGQVLYYLMPYLNKVQGDEFIFNVHTVRILVEII